VRINLDAERVAGTKGAVCMARAKKQASDPAEGLYAQAAREPAVAEMLREVHEALRLWRRCARRECRRARGCCGDPVACGARRWSVAAACLQAMKAREGGPLARVADRKGLQGAEPRVVTFQWIGGEASADRDSGKYP
jgi:hypothetical protein